MLTPLRPEAEAHLEQARHNYALYRKLADEGEYLDWALTTLFYASLQLVDAHAAQNEHPLASEHQARRLYIRNYLRSIHQHYRRLETASQDARYELLFPDELELQRYHDLEFQHIAAQLRNRSIAL
jgi:hypothetical protein